MTDSNPIHEPAGWPAKLEAPLVDDGLTGRVILQLNKRCLELEADKRRLVEALRALIVVADAEGAHDGTYHENCPDCARVCAAHDLLAEMEEA